VIAPSPDPATDHFRFPLALKSRRSTIPADEAVNGVSAQNPDNDDRIHLGRPVTAQALAPLLGVKPHQVLAELMTHSMFYDPKETIPDSVARNLARDHHRILEIDG
jgi:hypothetical protein